MFSFIKCLSFGNLTFVKPHNQPYRTTPLILPGAKINKNNLPTESYLRHHPNPAVRAAPQHDFHDVLMKQKVSLT